MKEINILDIENIKIGNAQDHIAGTGCSVILCENGAPTGLDIRGGGPASRESALLNPLAAADQIYGVVLSGGSAFGLDCTGGVMQYLEERSIGFDAGIAKVPLVCCSCIFDLIVGDKNVRPDKAMGYAAAMASQENNYRDGNLGAGTGATVGKYYGPASMMKSGIGSYAVQIGDLKIGAIVVVNALGNVYKPDSKEALAGLLNPDKTSVVNICDVMYQDFGNLCFSGNTTIGALITNAKFDKTQMNKIAAMAQNGYVRTIRPINTTLDGDSLYALSVGDVSTDINLIGTLGADVVAMAVQNAVCSAAPAYGLLCAADLQK